MGPKNIGMYLVIVKPFCLNPLYSWTPCTSKSHQFCHARNSLSKNCNEFACYSKNISRGNLWLSNDVTKTLWTLSVWFLTTILQNNHKKSCKLLFCSSLENDFFQTFCFFSYYLLALQQEPEKRQFDANHFHKCKCTM